MKFERSSAQCHINPFLEAYSAPMIRETTSASGTGTSTEGDELRNERKT